jgi:hypothetical protein
MLPTTSSGMMQETPGKKAASGWGEKREYGKLRM